MVTDNSETVNVKTAETVFSIIEILRELNGATLTEVASEFEMATSTIHNHLTTLRELGYVTRTDNTYHLSMRFLRLGNYVQYRQPAFELVEAAIQELAQTSGERATFVVLENALGSCVFTEGGSNAVELQIQPGDNLHLHCTAAGKAILAHLSTAEVAAIIDRWQLPERTANTIVDEDAFYEELKRVRDNDVAYNYEESIEGMTTIGAPIMPGNAPEPLGAISISAPAHRMDDDRLTGELRDLLLGTTNELELNIDHSV